MADKVWVDNQGNGDISVAANWDPAVAPANDDDLVFNRTQTSPVVTGLDQIPAVRVNSLHVHPLYTGDIGTSGNPLIIQTNTDGRIIKQGPGKFFIQAGTNGGNQIDYLYIDTDEQAETVEVDGEITYLSLIKGRIKALTGYNGNKAWVSYRGNPVSDVHWTIESTAQLELLLVNAGTVIHTGTTNVIALHQSAGHYEQGVSAGFVSEIIISGGSCIYNSNAATVAIAHVLGGILDFSQDGRDKTITLLAVFPGGKFYPNANTTITNNSPGSVYPIIPVIP